MWTVQGTCRLWAKHCLWDVGGLPRRRCCSNNPEMKPFSLTARKIGAGFVEFLIAQRLSKHGGTTKARITEKRLLAWDSIRQRLVLALYQESFMSL